MPGARWASIRLPLLTAIVAVAALVVTSCAPAEDTRAVRLDALEPLPIPASPERALRVVVSGVLSPQVTLQVCQRLVAYLGDRLDRPVQLLQRPTYAEVNDLIRTGQADIGLVCSGADVEGQRRFGMRLLVAPQVAGETHYSSYIIVAYS